MVTHHEAAHLELNYVTAFGLLLRVVGSDLQSEEAPPDASERLSGLVDLCRETHEVFATTSGVWRSHGDYDQALAEYPAYERFLRAGRSLSGNLMEGSFAAHTAMMCACWAAMQPPIGVLFENRNPAELARGLLGNELRPDHRLSVLLQAKLDPASIDVAIPRSWWDQELRSANITVPRMHETFVAVASAYYQAFAEILVQAGLPTYAFDGHKSDPILRDWLELHPPTTGEAIFFRPSSDGADRFWPVTISDGERVILETGRELVPVHLADLPARGDEHNVGWDTFVRGGVDNSSILVVVRPVRTLFKQYAISEEGSSLLRSAGTDGIITAVRADVDFESGRKATLLGVLSTRAQVEVLATMPAKHGVLASISEACNWFPNWSHYWTPAMRASAHAIRLADFPRRLWLDGLDAEQQRPYAQPFSIGPDPARYGIAGLVVWFTSEYDPSDPPFLVISSRRTVMGLTAALKTLFGDKTVASGSPPGWDRTFALIQRLVEGEPWFDARGLEDLPDIGKMGDLYQRAARAAER
jgi:hypothetical protein